MKKYLEELIKRYNLQEDVDNYLTCLILDKLQEGGSDLLNKVVNKIINEEVNNRLMGFDKEITYINNT